MNLRRISRFVIILVFLSSCFQKDCEEIEEKDITGYYISMYSLNRNLQYLEIMEEGLYVNRYCQNGLVIKETNEWEYSQHCTVTLANIYWLNSPSNFFVRGGANFKFNYGGILSLGEDILSFKKVIFRPKLECE